MNVQHIQGSGSTVADEARLRVSVLIDGELDDAEAERAIDELLVSPELGRFWADAHCAGDWMRSEEVIGISTSSGFMARFCRALDDEPPIVAPHAVVPASRSFWLRTGLPGASVAAAIVVVAWVAGPFGHADKPG